MTRGKDPKATRNAELQLTVNHCVNTLERAYPPALAESWDTGIGLIAGQPQAPVSRVAVAVDATDQTVAQALELGADLLVVHHPLLFSAVKSVATSDPKGRLLHALIAGGCALFAAHTNADSARPGVNDALAHTLGWTPGPPLVPTDTSLDRWVVTIPVDPGNAVDEVLSAVFAAGAGAIDGYSECAFTAHGTGQFRPGKQSNPAVGSRGELELVAEERVEFIAAPRLRGAVAAALIAAHPYEVPAYDIFSSAAPLNPDAQSTGLGRICQLDQSMTLRELNQHIADRLPATEWGVRAAGDPDAVIDSVAICGGAGSSLLSAAQNSGAQAYLTGDMGHHTADEFLRNPGPNLIDAAHWALEWPWCEQAAEILRDSGVRVDVLTTRTDPWTLSAHPR